MTRTQREYLTYIMKCVIERGYQPSLREVGEHFSRSPSTIYNVLKGAGIKYASYRSLSECGIKEEARYWR